MPNVMMGQRVSDRVRGYFGQGLKSSNKRYAADLAGANVPDTDKAGTRLENQTTAAYYLYQIQNNFRDAPPEQSYAEWLLDLEADVRSGNCGEMAHVAAHYARHDEHVPAGHIYLCQLLPPGQHWFCLITDAVLPPAQLQQETLFGFCRTRPNHLIIDPWLNTACLTGVYIRETRARLAKWQAEGKRVWWSGPNGNAEGWYPPSEQYKQAMQRSPVSLIPYA